MTAVEMPASTQTGPGPLPAAPEWRRLSPRMLLVHPVIELLRAAPALLGILYLSRNGGAGQIWSLVGLVGVVVYGVVRWLTTTYRVGPEQIQVRRGLVRRSVLSVPRDRVRTVDLTSHAMHRLLGLTRISIGTGTSDRKGDNGLRLDALTVAEATRLREELLHRSTAPLPSTATATGATPLAAAAGTVVARFRPAWLGYGPFSLSGLLPVVVVVGATMQFVSEAKLAPERLGVFKTVGDQLTRAPLGVAVAEVLAVCLVIVGLASTLGYLFRFWNFTLTRGNGVVHQSRGLVTTRAITIEERRLRGVEISEALVLRLVSGARCVAITTGLRVGHGAERGGSLLLPPAPRSEAERVAGAILDDPSIVHAPLVEHGPIAQRRRYTRAVVPALLLTGGLWLLHRYASWPDWSWQLSIPLVFLALILAKDRYRNLGHAMVGARLVIRRGALVRRRSMLSCDGIIGWSVYQSFFQRANNLVTLTATTAAGKQRYAVQDIGYHEALSLMDRAVPDLLTPFLAD